ncbi:hypothetical protein [Stieleria varia]|uniref:Uncharacterized protein n=1 Tax=Stieleria varia TaxID=2528005 RepID=A0A5C6B9S1_9BACT|nr:hypothetical protein [Stieleria varia]TWU08181.1 hypothetical protein Pla52n_07630 [Stieleria varia]
MFKKALIVGAIAVAAVVYTGSEAKADHCHSRGYYGGHTSAYYPSYGVTRSRSAYYPSYSYRAPISSYRSYYPSYGIGVPYRSNRGYGVGYPGFGYSGYGYGRSGISIGIGF